MIARPFGVWFCCCRWWEVRNSCWGCNSGDARCCSSLASVEPSITSPFLHAPILGEDFLWCIQHKMPVRAAPITNEANATAMAISRGTPTMTAWEEWCVGGRSSLSSGTTLLDFCHRYCHQVVDEVSNIPHQTHLRRMISRPRAEGFV